MRLVILFTSLVGVALVVPTHADDKPPEKLQGTWVATSAQRNGKAADEIVGHQLTFAGDKFTIAAKDGKLLYEGTIVVDTSKKPATIDFKHTTDALKGKTWKGIFALEGDSLKTCDNAPDLTKERPTDFAAKANSGQVAIVFKRAKK